MHRSVTLSQVAVEVADIRHVPLTKLPKASSTSLSLPERPGFIQCYNPATLERLGEVAVTQPEEVVAAVARARAAQKKWATSTWVERRRVLRTMAAAVRAHSDDILLISAIDTGKPREYLRVYRDDDAPARQPYAAVLQASTRGSVRS